MVLLILESLGSTELLFILVMALVFFGPRKLPQLSRSLGKNLASFRRSSEDFKRTWAREVSLEELNVSGVTANPATISEASSMSDDRQVNRPIQPPTIEAVAADRVVPRQTTDADKLHSDTPDSVDQAEPSRKRDWL